MKEKPTLKSGLKKMRTKKVLIFFFFFFLKKLLTKCPGYATIQSQVEENRTGAEEGRPYPNSYKMVTKNFFKKI